MPIEHYVKQPSLETEVRETRIAMQQFQAMRIRMKDGLRRFSEEIAEARTFLEQANTFRRNLKGTERF